MHTEKCIYPLAGAIEPINAETVNAKYIEGQVPTQLNSFNGNLGKLSQGTKIPN